MVHANDTLSRNCDLWMLREMDSLHIGISASHFFSSGTKRFCYAK